MRRIVPFLIVLLAFGHIMAVSGQSSTTNTSNYLSPEYNLTTTPSIAAFMNDSWQPSEFEAPVMQAAWQDKNKVVQNTSPAIYDVLNDTWEPAKFEGYENQALWPGKDGKIATSQYTILNFLKDSWTPNEAAAEVLQGPYTMHSMS